MPSVGCVDLFRARRVLPLARARVAGVAVLFAMVAAVLFVGTPVGAGLPGVVASFVSTIGQAAQPLTGTPKAVG